MSGAFRKSPGNLFGFPFSGFKSVLGPAQMQNNATQEQRNGQVLPVVLPRSVPIPASGPDQLPHRMVQETP